MFDILFILFYNQGVKNFLHSTKPKGGLTEWKIELKSTEKKAVFHKVN